MAKDNNNEIQQSKDNILSMIAITEDITRTTNNLYQTLSNLISNPGEIKYIKNSIDDLHNKINTLKGITIKAPLIENEMIVIPGPNDVSPLKDDNYRLPDTSVTKPPRSKKKMPPKPPRRKSQKPPTPSKTRKTQRPEQVREPRELVEEREIREMERPNRPLNNRKRTPQPNEDDQQK